MTSIVQTMQLRKTKHHSLPVSSPSEDTGHHLRRRLSSLSLNLQPSISTTSSWAIQRSKSLSELSHTAGSSVVGWWARGWGWLMTWKISIAKDLEMNEEEKHVVGVHNRGTLMHVFFKVKSHVRKLFGSNDMSLPY